MDFPKEFIASTKKSLPENEASNLFDALSQPPLVSIRLNPKKANTIEVPHEKIEHCSNGYFLKERPLFTADPALHAGAYYPQEANSMWIGEVFSFLKNEFQENPWTVLDMCAAPGGKTTDLSSRLDENDLLIANEVISHRNNILFENVCKWGDGNTVISQTDAKVFKQHPDLFDVVFCDAPCSGEGMFRKDPTAIKEWSLENVELCSKRQQRILFDTWNSLKPGGFFVYSTCTFNTKENEENVAMFCKETRGSLIGFEHPYIENLLSLQEKTYRCLPHKSKGEGLFFAIIQKPQETSFKTKKHKYTAPQIHIPFKHKGFTAIENHKKEIYLIKNTPTQTLLSIPGVVHFGIPIGSVIREKWKPHPAIALSTELRDHLPTVDLSDKEAQSYLKREFLGHSPKKQGGVALVWNGFYLGTANAVKNGLNNLLPMEWRVRGDFATQSILCL